MCGKVAIFFSKVRLSVRVRVRVGVSFSRCDSCETWPFTFDGQVGVQSWESDKKKGLGTILGSQSVQKWTFSKVGFSICGKLHFWWTRWCPNLGKWWSKCFWTKLGPNVWKKRTFSKVRADIRVRVRIWVSFSGCENLHFWWTRSRSVGSHYDSLGSTRAAKKLSARRPQKKKGVCGLQRSREIEWLGNRASNPYKSFGPCCWLVSPGLTWSHVTRSRSSPNWGLFFFSFFFLF